MTLKFAEFNDAHMDRFLPMKTLLVKKLAFSGQSSKKKATLKIHVK